MSKYFLIEGFKIPYLLEGKFKSFFPRTSKYLEFILPLRHPNLFDARSFKISNIRIYLVDDFSSYVNSSFKLSGDDKVNPFIASYLRGDKIILVDLKRLFNYGMRDFNPLQKDFSSSMLKKIIRHIDSISKYRSILIHEYEHFMQDEYNILLTSNESKVSRALSNFTQMDCEPLAKELMADYFTSDKNVFIQELAEYTMQPKEVEARLSQWIFMLIKGHSLESIKSFERDIFGSKGYFKDPTERFIESRSLLIQSETKLKSISKELKNKDHQMSYYRKRNDQINFSKVYDEVQILKSEFDTLKKSIPFLTKRSKKLHVAAVYFDHMSKEAIRVADLFKKKYSHLIDVI